LFRDNGAAQRVTWKGVAGFGTILRYTHALFQRRQSMKRVTSTIAMASMLAALAVPVSAPRAQSKGASASVRVGEVTAREQVELDNQSTQKGALIGGAIGLAAGSGKSGKTRRRRAHGEDGPPVGPRSVPPPEAPRARIPG
jgi:hypothetical protein